MPLLLGLISLGIVVLLLKWYADADVKTLKSSLRWTGILLGLLLVIGLAATGRLGAAMGFLVALTAWAWRVFGIVQMVRQIFGSAAPEQARQSGGPPSAPMGEDEALRVLGLARGASDADIKVAYRRLMGQVHPDHGGTDYLAAKLNAAKDILLKGRE